jgi:hypothetical protein
MWCSARLAKLLEDPDFDFDKVFNASIAPRWAPVEPAEVLSEAVLRRQQFETRSGLLAVRSMPANVNQQRLQVLQP